MTKDFKIIEHNTCDKCKEKLCDVFSIGDSGYEYDKVCFECLAEAFSVDYYQRYSWSGQ